MVDFCTSFWYLVIIWRHVRPPPPCSTVRMLYIILENTLQPLRPRHGLCVSLTGHRTLATGRASNRKCLVSRFTVKLVELRVLTVSPPPLRGCNRGRPSSGMLRRVAGQGYTFLRNVGNHLTKFSASQLKRQHLPVMYVCVYVCIYVRTYVVRSQKFPA